MRAGIIYEEISCVMYYFTYHIIFNLILVHHILISSSNRFFKIFIFIFLFPAYGTKKLTHYIISLEKTIVIIRMPILNKDLKKI